MDFETGEPMCDLETGETPAKPRLNNETGEEEINCTQPRPSGQKRPFKIPNGYIKAVPQKKRVAQNIVTRAQVGDKMSPIIVFLLPTVFFVPVVAIFLGITELLLHTWAHKKNKSLAKTNVYYQSPLHVIVSEFCACCVDERMKKKIGLMQDKRTCKFTTKNSAEYFRRVVS